MSTEELKRRKLYILQEIEALRALQEEACIRIDTRIELIASSSSLHPLHLKAFAQDWQDVNGLVSNLKEIAVEDIEYSKRAMYAPRTVKAIHLQDTQYKSSSSDPDVYWTKPKALIVLDRLGKGAFNGFEIREAKQEISKLFTEYEEIINDRVLQILNQAVYMSKMKRENNE